MTREDHSPFSTNQVDLQLLPDFPLLPLTSYFYLFILNYLKSVSRDGSPPAPLDPDSPGTSSLRHPTAPPKDVLNQLLAKFNKFELKLDKLDSMEKTTRQT